jgi:Lon protease-like protein
MADTFEIPMFPLGSVLFPAMPLPLRVFEPRYLQMLQDVLPDAPAEFGVVLIERGQEVGGGERRIEVLDWLAEDPYPRALVRELPPLEWDEDLRERRDQTEALVRRTLVRVSEFDDLTWSPTVQLSDDPVDALWQLAAVAPVGALDQLGLLRCGTTRQLLDAIFSATQDAGETLEARGL